MLYQILTITNLTVSCIAIVCLVNVARRYYAGPRVSTYIFSQIISVVMLMSVQFYTLTYPPQRFGTWIYKLPGFYWLGTVLLFAWVIRFNLIRKDPEQPHRKIEPHREKK
jgi:hypothetical protein